MYTLTKKEDMHLVCDLYAKLYALCMHLTCVLYAFDMRFVCVSYAFCMHIARNI